MAVPRKKVTRAKRDQRRAHDALRAVGVTECPQCGEAKLPHHICGNCGYYRDRAVLLEDEAV